MAGTAGVRAGRAFIVIEAVDRTAATLDRISSRLRAFSAKVMTIGRNLSMASITLMAPLVVATKAFTDFDDAMKRVEARSKGTEDQMAAVRKQAREIGAETVFAASEIGNLQSKIAQKGFNRQQIVQMTPAITDLAIAAGEGADRMQDAEDAALLTTGTLRAFRLEADQVGRVSDVMSYAVNNSNFTMRALITALEYAGPVAADYGASLEEVVTALAQMANLNIHPSIAGTSLRNMYLMMSRADEVDKFNRKLSDLTGTMVKIEAGADKKFHLPEVLFALGEAMKNLDPLQKGNLLHDLIGLRPMQAGIALSRGQNPFQNFLDDMLKNTGSGQYVEAVREKMDSGIGGALRRLKGAVEDLATTIGETLEKSVTSLVGLLNNWINKVSGVIQANQRWVSVLGGLLIGTLALGVSLIFLGLTIKIVGLALAGLSGAITLVTGSLTIAWAVITGIFTSLTALVNSPIVLLTAFFLGIVALTLYATGYLDDFWECIKNGVNSTIAFLADLKSIWATTIDAMVTAISGGKFQAAWDVFTLGIEVSWLTLKDKMLDIWESLALSVKQIWHGVMGYIEDNTLALQGSLAKYLIALAGEDGIYGAAARLMLGQDLRRTPDTAKADMMADIDQQIAADRSAAAAARGKALQDAQRDALNSNTARETILAQRRKDLDDLAKKIDTPDIKWHADDEDPDTMVFKWDPQAANALIQAGIGSIPPEANMGVYKDSVEAARAFQENRAADQMAALVRGQADGNELQADGNELLAGIKSNLDKMNVQAV